MKKAKKKIKKVKKAELKKIKGGITNDANRWGISKGSTKEKFKIK